MGRQFGTGAPALAQRFFHYILLIGLLGGVNALATTHLFLVGGGTFPNEALARFAKLAGGAKGNILVINWATTVPVESFQYVSDCLTEAAKPAGVPTAVTSMSVDQVRQSKPDFIKQLNAATAVFFVGGDQTRIMDLLVDPNFADLADLMRARFDSGIPFGGTSAGMAIMSREMFAGTEDITIIDPKQPNLFRPGLGLLPGVMVDTHFLIRQRENRLFSYLLGHPETLGLGIDQDGVLEVTDGQFAEVIGNKQVMVGDAVDQTTDLLIRILHPGDQFDILSRRRISDGLPGATAVMCSAHANL